ncbi:hypothetical protein TWF506_010482 [Arthrobotrys conoides]|uniref:Uncharacterized protein n=1 Tax=Arthrobotrys conoides TaxID=74498 RepID=A0AAN8N1P7_9PEZI
MIVIFISCNVTSASPLSTPPAKQSINPKDQISPNITHSTFDTNVKSISNSTSQWLPATDKNLTTKSLEAAKTAERKNLSQPLHRSEPLGDSSDQHKDIEARSRGWSKIDEGLFYLRKGTTGRVWATVRCDEPTAQLLARYTSIMDGSYTGRHDYFSFTNFRQRGGYGWGALSPEAIGVQLRLRQQICLNSCGCSARELRLSPSRQKKGCTYGIAVRCEAIIGCYCSVGLRDRPPPGLPRQVSSELIHQIRQASLRIPDRIRNLPINRGLEWRFSNESGGPDLVIPIGTPLEPAPEVLPIPPTWGPETINPAAIAAPVPAEDSFSPDPFEAFVYDPIFYTDPDLDIDDPGEGSSTGITRISNFGPVNVAPSSEPPFWLSGPTDADINWSNYLHGFGDEDDASDL